MSALKTSALTVLVWGMLATLVQAGPMPLLWDWTAWASGTRVISGTMPLTSGESGASASGTTGSAGQSAALSAAPTPPPPPPTSPPDAYLNFGTSSYLEQGTLTTGTAAPWFDSPSVTKVYGGTPTAAQQQDFITNVENDVEHTFTASGLTGSNAVTLTTDPKANAIHELSVVSGLSYGPNPGAIGITDVGANGFSFIDKLSYANTPQDLEWAVAHNITHELMHAFGVAVHHDQTGNYLDAATARWSLLIDPTATLSAAAVADIVAHNIGRNGNTAGGVGGELIDGDQELLAPVPEPSTIAFWGLASTALIFQQRRRAVRRRAA